MAALSYAGWYWYKTHPQEKNEDPRYNYEVVKDYPTTDRSPTRNPEVPAEAMEAYDHAKDAVYESNLIEAEKLLKKAVELKPDFTEAWYNLGATQSRLAILAMKQQDEKTSVQYFHAGVESKKKSRELMIQHKWFEYNEEQQAQTRADVEQALSNADELLLPQNESTLIQALKISAE